MSEINFIDAELKRLNSEVLRLNKMIDKLEELRALRDGTALVAKSAKGAAPKSASTKPNAFKGKGFVTQVLPVLQSAKAPVAAKLLYDYLRKQPGMRNVSRASFDSTMNSELRKSNPRIARTAPGFYIATVATPQGLPTEIPSASELVQEVAV